MNDSKADQMAQKIERDIRLLIGDQQIQIIMLRNLVDSLQQTQQEPRPTPNPRED
jgi:hypothetical protein